MRLTYLKTLIYLSEKYQSIETRYIMPNTFIPFTLFYNLDACLIYARIGDANWYQRIGNISQLIEPSI